MSATNWVVVGLFLGGLGTQLASVQDWHAIMTPGWVAGLLLSLSSTIVAFFSQKPGTIDDKKIALKNRPRSTGSFLYPND
jgi:hypothetical protein